MMISGRQIKAARTLLNWDAELLASKAKLSRDTVFNIENGKVQARGSSADKIMQVFAAHGLEFISDRGVALRDESVRQISGPRALYEFLDDVYATVRNGGQICVTGVDERLFDQHTSPEDKTHSTRMAALGDKITMRCILREGDTNIAHNNYITYRWMPKDQFDASPMYVYNHKLAMINFSKKDPHIVIIDAPTMAQAFCKQFDFIWAYCKELPHVRSKP